MRATGAFCVPPALDLVAAIEGGVAREPDLRRLADHVGAALADHLAPLTAGLPPIELPAPGSIVRHLVHAARDGSFSVVVIDWGQGATTTVHDHLSWCVVGMLEGEQTETAFELVAFGPTTALLPRTEERHTSGTVEAIVPPGDIHLVANGSGDACRSVHIYGADLSITGTSCRRHYDDLPRLYDL